MDTDLDLDAALQAEKLAAQLAEMAGRVTLLQGMADDWPAAQRAVMVQLREAVEALHREALVRLVKGLRSDPAAAAQLKRVVHDPFVFGVLRLHGIVRDPLEQRVRDALASVAPMLAEHGGGVELVSVLPPDTVEVRLTGSCQSCPSSGQTLSEGVERAIKEFAPEVIRVKQVRRSGLPPQPGQAQTIHFISPFAKNSARAGDAGFAELCGLDELPPKQAIARTLGEQALLLYRDGEEVSCVSNACAHLGLTMDGGRVADGVIECPHHGFRYLLASGECLDVPEVQLVVHAVRVRNGRVAVKLGA